MFILGNVCLATGEGTYLGQGVPTLDGNYLPWTGGYLPWMGGTYIVWGNPLSGWMVVPHGRQSSTVSTCYAVGGMPLAFMQDFLAYDV